MPCRLIEALCDNSALRVFRVNMARKMISVRKAVRRPILMWSSPRGPRTAKFWRAHTVLASWLISDDSTLMNLFVHRAGRMSWRLSRCIRRGRVGEQRNEDASDGKARLETIQQLHLVAIEPAAEYRRATPPDASPPMPPSHRRKRHFESAAMSSADIKARPLHISATRARQYSR